MKADHLALSKVKKTELYDFMKETRNKEEYRRASAIKQKLEGLRKVIKNEYSGHIVQKKVIGMVIGGYITAIILFNVIRL